MGLENSGLTLQSLKFQCSRLIFLLERVTDRRPSILIAYTLTSGCGQSGQNHECGKHGLVQFCVKF